MIKAAARSREDFSAGGTAGRRSMFERVDGLCERPASSRSDVDLFLRIGAGGIGLSGWPTWSSTTSSDTSTVRRANPRSTNWSMLAGASQSEVCTNAWTRRPTPATSILLLPQDDRQVQLDDVRQESHACLQVA
jgi:hypothetical protein